MTDDDVRVRPNYGTQFAMGILAFAAFFAGVIMSGTVESAGAMMVAQSLMIGGIVGFFLALAAAAIESAIQRNSK